MPKRGYAIVADRSDRSRGSVYRIRGTEASESVNVTAEAAPTAPAEADNVAVPSRRTRGLERGRFEGKGSRQITYVNPLGLRRGRRSVRRSCEIRVLICEIGRSRSTSCRSRIYAIRSARAGSALAPIGGP